MVVWADPATSPLRAAAARRERMHVPVRRLNAAGSAVGRRRRRPDGSPPGS